MFNLVDVEISSNYKNIPESVKNKFKDIDSVINRVGNNMKFIGQSIEDYYGFDVIIQGLDNKIFDTLNYLFSKARLSDTNSFDYTDPDKVFKYAVAIHPFLFPQTDDSQRRRQEISDESPPPFAKRFCTVRPVMPLPTAGVQNMLTKESMFMEGILQKFGVSNNEFLTILDERTATSLMRVYFNWKNNNGRDFLNSIKQKLNIISNDFPDDMKMLVNNVPRFIGAMMRHYRVEVSLAEPLPGDYTRTWNAFLTYCMPKSGVRPNQDVIILD